MSDTEMDRKSAAKTASGPGWIPYTVPTALFILMTFVEGAFPKQYVALYMTKAALVTLSVIVCRSTLRDYRPDWRVALPAALVGLLIFLIWIPLDRVTPFHPAAGNRAAFNPFRFIPNETLRDVFLAVRFYGLVVLAPVIEELFWRSFLLRYLSNVDGDFRSQPIGSFTWTAFAITAGAFALAHPEWLSALVCAIVYGLLLWRTRSLFAVLMAHSLTNLLLGLFILHSHAWRYW